MDTKLKNRHKLAVITIILSIVIAASVMMSMYPVFYKYTASERESINRVYLSSESFLESFLDSSYILYNLEDDKVQGEAELNQYYPAWREITDSLHPYVDYQVEDESKKVLDSNTMDSKGKLNEAKLSDYEFGLSITYDDEGYPDVDLVTGEFRKDQSVVLKKIIQNITPQKPPMYDDMAYKDNGNSTLSQPKSRTYIYAMSTDNVGSYLQNQYYMPAFVTAKAMYFVVGFVIIMCMLALFLPRVKSFHTGDEKIFHVYFEIVLLAGIIAAGLISHFSEWLFTRENGYANGLDFLIWAGVFALAYWAASCLRQIKVVGIKKYLKERTICYPLGIYLKKGIGSIWKRGKAALDKLYHSIDDIDFHEKNNKIILNMVLINFIILTVICCLWFFGIVGLVIYSVILFLVLQKYFNDLREKYAVILKATNEIAEGNLDVEITEDIGVFTPFRTEIEKIQSGFKKAVKEEVKSQKLKTELITNVSHDLKTPLTAIITYVNLLKEETDEEKRKNYTDILEQKSLRLKVLIEDLFEISKASSENVKLDLMNVDIVNLYKQVQLEQNDKIEKAGLTFRCNYPEEKITLLLDSQKTYRIFENLLVNITKYSMPDTRVYVDIFKEGTDVVIRMKNMSATELDFDPGQLTERFVRGDVARNTEGSGLGLAIVKSFVELQKGKFKIETEADLFRAEIRWRCEQATEKP